MRTKSHAGGRRKLPRPLDPPAPSSTFPLEMSSKMTNMLETSEKEVHDGGKDEDWLKKDTCIRCDERGSLLICNVSDCPIAIHENCMSCKPTFDDERNFYCPYCSYKRAIIQANKLEKKVMTAKKALSSFIGSGVPIGNNSEQKDGMSEKVEDHPVQVEHNRHIEKNSKKTKSRIISEDEGDHPISYAADDSDIDSSESDAEATKDFTTKENSSEANVNGRVEEVELSPNANVGSHVNYAGGDTPLKRKRHVKAKAQKLKRQQKSGFPRRSPRITDEEIEGDAAKNAEEVLTSKILEENHESVEYFEKTRSEMVSGDDESQPDSYATDVRDSPETECELPKDFMSKESFSDGDVDGRLDEKELPVNTNLGSQPKHAGGEAPLKRKRRVKTKACKIKKQHNSDFPRRSPRALNKEIEKDPANKIEDVSKSKMSKVDLNSVKKIKTPILSNAKRRRLQWTTEEEEMLREGVKKISSSVNKNLPWRKILEFGNHVFDVTRSPVDLKDKWRKIQARESFSEQ